MTAYGTFDPSTKDKTRPSFADWMSQTNEITRTFLAAGKVPGLINLAGGLPAPQIYPADEIAQIARQVIKDNPIDTLGYGSIEGLADLRDALAKRFSTSGVRLTADNVLVTTSGMQGLDLLGKVLLDQGDLVAGQFPTYLGALDAWRPRGPQFRNMDIHGAAFDPDAALSGAKFAYTVPNFSNPTGKLVGEAIRQKLVDGAHRTGVWLVEDDPYGGLCFEGTPPPRMLELSARMGNSEVYDGPVIYMGTVSKELAPGLRVGWIIAAPEMIGALTLAKQGSDISTSGITQRIVLGALNAGLIERLQPQLCNLYRARRDALCAAMAEHLSEWFEWEVPEGGMFVWAKARAQTMDTDALLQPAMAGGVCIAPSSVFDATGVHCGAMRMNFTLNDPDTLTEGVRRLATVLKTIDRKGP
ncbi:PLP-dependent aminotransferase family protein [Pacificibacter sp. AS14]|uniref:aminotransferase-like domain-containing protein n=1 Tax=Pacificibacter sp. AS14 TaxID=3135785 RepID=UPI00317A79EF